MKKFYTAIKNNYLKNKYVNAVLNLLIAASLFAAAFFYFYNYGYIYWLAFLALPILFLFLFLFIYVGPKNALSINYWQSVVKRLFNKTEFSISCTKIFLYAFFISIVIANVFLLDFTLSKRVIMNSVIDFLFYEANIWKNVSSLLIFCLVFIILAWSWGEKILTLIKLKIKNKLESFVLSIGLGLIPLMFGVFFLAWLKLLYAPFIWLLIIILSLLSYKKILDNLKSFGSIKLLLSIKSPKDTFKTIILFSLFILLCFSFVINIKPFPITTDDLHTYYNAPALYAEYHEFRPLYHHATANMGQNTEMIYAAIMTILNTKYIIHLQLIFFVLSCLGIYLFLKNMFNSDQAWTGLLFAIFIPWNPYYISTVKVEFFMVFYSVAMLLALFYWWKNGYSAPWLYLFGALSGIAIGIKYNTLLLILPLFLLVIILLTQSKLKNKIKFRQFIIAAILLIIFFSPWAIKNQIYFNNILYPREISPFLVNNNSPGLMSDKAYSKARSKEINYLRHARTGDKYNPINIISSLWRQSTGHKIDRGAWINFGFLPFIVILLGIVAARKKKEFLILGLLIGYFSLWYALEGARSWYAFFGIIMACAFAPIIFWKYKKILGIILLLTIFSCLFNAFVLAPNIKYLLGATNAQEYKKITIPYSGLADYINNELDVSKENKILIIKDFRVAFINNNDEIVLVDQYLSKINSALDSGDDEFKKYLKKNSISYIVDSQVNEKHFLGWLEKHSLSQEEYLANYKGNKPSIYEDFQVMSNFLQNNAELLYNDNDYSLYKIIY